jgi:hypothetical protein
LRQFDNARHIYGCNKDSVLGSHKVRTAMTRDTLGYRVELPTAVFEQPGVIGNDF